MKSGVIAVALCFQCLAGLSFGAEYKLVWPNAASKAEIAATANEKFVTQAATVSIPIDAVVMCAQMKEGDVVQLNFFGNAGVQNAQAQSSYNVTVQSVTSDQNGVVSVSGTADGQPMETFVLSTSEDGFMLSLQDIEKQRLYRVVGDPRKGEAVVRDIDLTKMPQRYDGHDLVRPVQAKAINEGK